MPVHQTEHTLAATPLFAQSLLSSGTSTATAAIGPGFAIIQAARMLPWAGPITSDAANSIVESRAKQRANINQDTKRELERPERRRLLEREPR